MNLLTEKERGTSLNYRTLLQVRQMYLSQEVPNYGGLTANQAGFRGIPHKVYYYACERLNIEPFMDDSILQNLINGFPQLMKYHICYADDNEKFNEVFYDLIMTIVEMIKEEPSNKYVLREKKVIKEEPDEQVIEINIDDIFF